MGRKFTVTTIVAMVTIALVGTATANDWVWTNAGGDLLWNNSANWNEYGGGCGAYVGNSVPTAGNGWIIINTLGDANGCPGVWPDPSQAAGMGPVVDTSISNAGGYVIIANNNVDISSPCSSKAGTFVGGDSGTTGTINMYDGGELNVQYAYTKNFRGFYLGGLYWNSDVGGTGILNMYGGLVWIGRYGDLHCGSNATMGEAVGTINQYGGIINVFTSSARYQKLYVECGTGAGTSSVNLYGGELRSRGFPGIGANGVINIDGGKLVTRDYDTADDDIAAAITSGQIVGTGGSTDPNDGNWKIKHWLAIDTPLFEDVVTIQSPIPTCELSVSPYDAQDLGLIPVNSNVDVVFTVTNEGTGAISYTVAENPDETWLSLDKTSSGPLAGSIDGLTGGSETVTATINTTGMTPGVYTANLVFSEDCSSVEHARSFTFEVVECALDVSPKLDNPDAFADITVYSHCINPQDVPITITNIVGADRNYTIQEVDDTGTPTDYPWLTLDKTSGGPIALGESDTVVATITGTPNEAGFQNIRDTAYVLITPDCGIPEMRRIDRDDTWLGLLFGHKRAYLGNVPPNDPLWTPGADGPCGPGCNFNIIGTQTGTVVIDNASPDPDYNAQNRYAFKIDEGTVEEPGPDPIGRNGYASDVNTGDNNNSFSSRIGETMVARVKVLRDYQMGPNLWIRDNNSGSGNSPPAAGCRVRWNASNTVYEFVNAVGPFTAGNGKADAYHTIRIIDGYGPYGTRTVKVWVDEDQFPDPALEIAGGIPEGENQYDAFCFGTFGGASYSELYYDWISFTNAGMYGPGEDENCFGESLIPTFCNDPFADADGDGDVDQDDFAAFQICYTGPGGGVPDDCSCFDNDADGDIDTTDLGDFENCASGPAIPADPACDDLVP